MVTPVQLDALYCTRAEESDLLDYDYILALASLNPV